MKICEEMNVEEMTRLTPKIYALDQNFPNPFNPNTRIQFTLGHEEIVSLNILTMHH